MDAAWYAMGAAAHGGVGLLWTPGAGDDSYTASHVSAMGAVTEGLYSLFAHSDSRLQALRRWGLQGFDRSGALKRWVVRQAAGHAPLQAGH